MPTPGHATPVKSTPARDAVVGDRLLATVAFRRVALVWVRSGFGAEVDPLPDRTARLLHRHIARMRA